MRADNAPPPYATRLDDDPPGLDCLRSNRTDWDEATLWRTDFTLADLKGGSAR